MEALLSRRAAEVLAALGAEHSVTPLALVAGVAALAAHLGIAFVANSVWIILLFPAVIAYVHFVDILREERLLQQQFGQEFLEYRKRVRRYF